MLIYINAFFSGLKPVIIAALKYIYDLDLNKNPEQDPNDVYITRARAPHEIMFGMLMENYLFYAARSWWWPSEINGENSSAKYFINEIEAFFPSNVILFIRVWKNNSCSTGRNWKQLEWKHCRFSIVSFQLFRSAAFYVLKKNNSADFFCLKKENFQSVTAYVAFHKLRMDSSTARKFQKNSAFRRLGLVFFLFKAETVAEERKNWGFSLFRIKKKVKKVFFNASSSFVFV